MRTGNGRGYDGNLTPPLGACSTGVRASAQGMDPQLRRDVWKYLLNYVPFHATHAERDHIMATKRSVKPSFGWGRGRAKRSGADNQPSTRFSMR